MKKRSKNSKALKETHSKELRSTVLLSKS